MKIGSLIGKILRTAALVAVIAYFGVQIYRYASDPMLTTPAYAYQVEDTVEISGWVVRQEQVLPGDSGGLVQLRRSEGERVSTGGTVAVVYADQASLDRQSEMETLKSRIDQLEFAQESMLGAEATLKLDSQISQALLEYRTAAAAGRMDTAESHGQELRSLVLKRDFAYSGTEDLSGQLQELRDQLKALRAQAAGSVKSIRSPRSGLFSAVVDGYETVLTPEMLSSLTPGTLDKLTPEDVSSAAGKLVLGDSWYYAGDVSAGEAETLREKFMNHYDSDDLLGFMFSCMEKEHDRVLYHLKEDIGIEYLPVELLRDAIGDHPEQIGLDWEKNGADIRALCYARFQNLFHKNQPTYLTVTRKGMERFAKTGRLSDHVACFRSFTPEERKWILEFICCQAETVPSFSIRFMK